MAPMLFLYELMKYSWIGHSGKVEVCHNFAFSLLFLNFCCLLTSAVTDIVYALLPCLTGRFECYPILFLKKKKKGVRWRLCMTLHGEILCGSKRESNIKDKREEELKIQGKVAMLSVH